jgi:uncharacterized protein YkwD
MPSSQILTRDASDNRNCRLLAFIGFALLITPASALDLNSFRAANGRPPLSPSVTLSGAAYAYANEIAARQLLDHKGFSVRMPILGGAAAENVLWGCDTEDCAIRRWAKSGGHRTNMLREDVSSYGIASAAAGGRRYWVLELGN